MLTGRRFFGEFIASRFVCKLVCDFLVGFEFMFWKFCRYFFSSMKLCFFFFGCKYHFFMSLEGCWWERFLDDNILFILMYGVQRIVAA